MASWSTTSWSTAMAVLVAAVAAAPTSTSPALDIPTNEIEVPVVCVPSAEDIDAVLCRAVVAVSKEGGDDGVLGAGSAGRGGRRLLGRIGFLTGLHLGGAISSSGSLSASHSLNVFGKVMNTALSVSYGPNGYYQGPGAVGGRPPGFGVGGLADDQSPASPPSSSSTSTSSSSSVSASASSSPDKGNEASAVLAGTLSRGTLQTGIARVELAAPTEETPQNRLPVAEDIVGATDRVKVVVGAPAGATVVTVHNKDFPDAQRREDAAAEPAPVHEDPDEEVGEEPLPEPEPPAASAPAGVQLSAQRRAQLEAVARVRTPSADEQRRLFLQHHNQHVAVLNRHHAKYSGDVSRVAVFSRT